MVQVKSIKIFNNSLLVLSFIFLLSSCSLNKQQLTSEEIFAKWNLDNYVILGEIYALEEIEKSDYINLKKDMTFVSQSVEKKYSGSFVLNNKEGCIIMKDEQGVEVKVFVVHVSNEELIFVYNIETIREMGVHYKSELVKGNWTSEI